MDPHAQGWKRCIRVLRPSERSAGGINGDLITHARITGPLWRPKHCARATAPKHSWVTGSPTRTADARPTHRQTVRADQRVRGQQRDGIDRDAPNNQSEPPGRRRVDEKQTRLRETRGSFVPKFRGSRVCFACQSEGVFVSFVWVNSCRKD
jgi:hypothetical protein